jgi:hypothetical protein
MESRGELDGLLYSHQELFCSWGVGGPYPASLSLSFPLDEREVLLHKSKII